MRRKDITYLDFQKLVKDKDTSVNNYICNFMNMLHSMFVYEGVPYSIDIDKTEYLLKTNGHVIITPVNGVLYTLSGNFTGDLNAYYEPTQYIVTNPYLPIAKTFTIGEDCVLIKNDAMKRGLMPVLGKYAVMLTDSDISLNTAAVLSRITMLISASDDKTKASADLFLQKIADGDFSVIGENAFFDGVKMHTAPTANTNYITQLIELTQYYKASLYNEMGLNANYNLKRERLTNGELEVNVDALLPLMDNMMQCRKKAWQQVNEKYNTDIRVNLGSAWSTIHNSRNSTYSTTQSTLTKTDEQILDEI